MAARRSLIPCTVSMTSSGRLSQASNTPSPSTGSSTVKKYKAALSTESKTRIMAKSSSASGRESPRTPSRSRPNSRPTTPIMPDSPRTPIRSQSRCENIFMESEMDVSRIDPEEVLVDAENVEIDVSAELDERELRSLQYGNEDKVHVSVRVRPTDETQAWTVAPLERSLKLIPQFHKSSATPVPEYHYDEVLTGTDNKPVYNAAARSHVNAAMDGYNAVVFAYGQTASGKTFTLTGTEAEPGIIPRAMKDVFAYIRRTPNREYLLRCSYLEIYNEAIFDLLAPPASRGANTVQIQGIGENVFLAPLREEVVTSLKGVHDVLERGYGNRRTASTDWNERSSRSHSVFRLVIESRERSTVCGEPEEGRSGPIVPPTPGGPRLQSRGGRSVQTSVLSLIDLAGSERATSDKDRTREGRYINTSLLTLGSVIGTLAENALKKKSDHVPFRNSKLTRMLQPSLSGNARISVICTINPGPSAVAESTSTLLFAQRVKRVQLNAKKKEVVDTDALLERYRKEIEDLKQRLAEREVAPVRKRRLSAQEQLEESRAMSDLNSRIQQLTKLILTSQSVDESKGDQSRPGSPSKLDFNLEPYQLQQDLLSARRQIESQATQILSLEATLLARPELPLDAPEQEKDKLIAEQTKTIRELEVVVRGYEENLGEPLRAVKEDVEKEWIVKVEEERKVKEEKEAWASELMKELEREKQLRTKLEEERKALVAFVGRFDSLGLASEPTIPSRLRQPSSLPLGPTAFASRRRRSYNTSASASALSLNSSGLSAVAEVNTPNASYDNYLSIALTGDSAITGSPFASPLKKGSDLVKTFREAPSLLDFSTELAEVEGMVDLSFEGVQTSLSVEALGDALGAMDLSGTPTVVKVAKANEKAGGREVEDKENILPVFV